ncbi:hypothetical protein FOXB_01533 [Fusarium oxysporum f. sp. conglutinans Fo5176]|uniref:Uncharacterized protein n=1 Tax=Fusarium oxysporum (strain Fo5176) TaxID=660025 RepID=F9F558_FUSOF|nr:hypothetical protein FOXB_01533 [Fusarium oxysporum f. sp. conglutinans Fo5176]
MGTRASGDVISVTLLRVICGKEMPTGGIMLRFKLRKIDAEYFGSESDPGLISKLGQSLDDDWLTELNQSRQ